MTYTNSPMVDYRQLSPHHSGQRTESIDRITPHCVVGQCTAVWLGELFSKPSTQASSNYGIDRDGRIGMYVEESDGDTLGYSMVFYNFGLEWLEK